MRRASLLIVAVVVLMLVAVSPVSAATTTYPDITFPSGLQQTVEPGMWDLTQGPVTISYTLDLSGAPNIPATGTMPLWWLDADWDLMGMVGLFSGSAGARMVGYNSDPALGLLPTYPDNNGSLDTDDKFNLQRFPNPGSYDEAVYDVDCTDPSAPTLHAVPVTPQANHGVWFDRDGVDPWQDDDPLTPAPGGSAVPWGSANGDTYNTGGIYDVVLTFAMIDSTHVGICPMVNDRPTGFYVPAYHAGVPDFYPAGISFTASEAQMQSMRVRAEGASDGGAITVSDLTVDGHLLYGFEGFFQPIDNTEVNAAKAGQVVPVKWRLSDYLGTPISDPATFTSITSVAGGGSCAGEPIDAVEEYVAGSGLQYLGDGYWQFNWKTPKSYAGQCRIMVLTLDDGSTHAAEFLFK